MCIFWLNDIKLYLYIIKGYLKKIKTSVMYHTYNVLIEKDVFSLFKITIKLYNK